MAGLLPTAPFLGGYKDNENPPSTAVKPEEYDDDDDDDDVDVGDSDDDDVLSPTKGTFDTEDDTSAFQILPDDEDDQQQQQKLRQHDVGLGGDDGDDDDDDGVRSVEQEKAKNITNAYDSPPVSPKSQHQNEIQEQEQQPSSPSSPKSSRQRKFMNRFAHSLSMSPKRQLSDKNIISMTKEQSNKEEKATNMNSRNRFSMPLASEMGMARSPIPTFKTMKARAAAVMTKNIEMPLEGVAGDEDFGSSDDDYSDDDILSIGGDDSFLFEDDIVDQEIDFIALSYVPNSFLDLPPNTYDFCDSDIVKNIGEQSISTFAWEHHLLVKGLLQLLAERDHIGVEDDVHATSNILKMGPLKKRYAPQFWFVKFVEVRKGNLSFYDDESSSKKSSSSSMKDNNNNNTNLQNDDSARRRTIHLRKRTCTCQAVTAQGLGGGGGFSGGYVFELKVEGGPRRLWMAKSEEERQAWVRAINQAMIGEDDDVDDILDANQLDLMPYQNAIDAYESVQSSLQQVKTRQEFLVAVDSLLYRQRSSSALRLPINWIRQQVHQKKNSNEKEVDDENINLEEKPLAAKRHVRSTVHDFWDNLCKTSVVINGFLIEANESYSAERVVGALSRCILEFDKVEEISNNESSSLGVGAMTRNPKESKNDDERISELEAVSHGRSMIRSILRSKGRGDALSAVEELVCNDGLFSCVEVSSSRNDNNDISKSHGPPIHIDVSFAGDDFSDSEPLINDISGWVSARTRKSKRWKERYFVVSEGVLSFFAKADPRPSGLRGQLVLADAKVKQICGTGEDIDNMMISLQARDTNREVQLRFDNRGDFVRWKTVLERAMEQLQGEEAAEEHPKSTSATSNNASRGSKIGRARSRAKKGMKRFMNAMGYSNARRDGRNGDSAGAVSSTRHRPTNEMLRTSTWGLQELDHQKASEKRREPSVQVVIELNNVFKVIACSEENGDNMNQDALLIVRVKVFQAFLLSGGVNGRLAKGDEVLEMEFMEGDDLEEMEHEFLEPPTVL